jgi:hypothetical protein
MLRVGTSPSRSADLIFESELGSQRTAETLNMLTELNSSFSEVSSICESAVHSFCTVLTQVLSDCTNP